VVKTNTQFKLNTATPAFTMIELIFAIVIIGITALTLPTILLNNNRSVEQNLEQEAVFVSATKMAQILTYAWDDQSRDPAFGLLVAKADVLDVTTGDLDFNRSGSGTDFRRGHFQQALHRRMTPHLTPRVVTDDTALGAEAGDRDDIDDFNGLSEITIASGTQRGYKNTYTLNMTVGYVDDGVASGVNYFTDTALDFDFNTTILNQETNIKMVEISVDKSTAAGGTFDETNIIVLRSYSSNIGETDYHKRTY
jgi:prepilin-type N-terminal cleavage/methylation domain-containing protein